MAGSCCAAPPTSLFTRSGADQVRPPSRDFVKKMSDCVVDPPQPPKARYSTPCPSMAIEGWYELYAGAAVTGEFGPNQGGVATAADAGADIPSRPTTARAATRPTTTIALACEARGRGFGDISPCLLRECTPSTRIYLRRTVWLSKGASKEGRGVRQGG